MKVNGDVEDEPSGAAQLVKQMLHCTHPLCGVVRISHHAALQLV